MRPKAICGNCKHKVKSGVRVYCKLSVLKLKKKQGFVYNDVTEYDVDNETIASFCPYVNKLKFALAGENQ